MPRNHASTVPVAEPLGASRQQVRKAFIRAHRRESRGTLVSGAASVLSLAFTRGGLRASIGLLVTAGQVSACALRAAAGRLTVATVILTVSIAISRRWGRQVPVDESLGLELAEDERERLMAGLYVVLGTDGSVRVHGIPGSLDAKLRTRIAQVAAHAAGQRLESLVSKGRRYRRSTSRP